MTHTIYSFSANARRARYGMPFASDLNPNYNNLHGNSIPKLIIFALIINNNQTNF